jgi:hypothetical protein
VVGCCLGAAALAATRSEDSGRERSSHPLQPRLTEYPDRVTTAVDARFDSVQPGRPPALAVPGKPLRLECRLDGGDWERCRLPTRFTDLDLGQHRFDVRAVNSAGRFGPAATFVWRVRRDPVKRESYPAPEPAPPARSPAPSPEPPVPPPALPEGGAPFTIEQVGELEDLFPGEPAQALSLRLTNPNPVAIEVIALTFSFAADPPGCSAAENFIVVPSDASTSTPVAIAAESSIELPAQGVSPPEIAMRELPVDQNACQGAPLELKLEGEARG